MTMRAEQETVVVFGRDEDVVRIYTSIPAHARRLRAEARVTQVAGDETYGDFTVPVGEWRPIAFKTRRTYTPEQRAAMAERLKAARS